MICEINHDDCFPGMRNDESCSNLHLFLRGSDRQYVLHFSGVCSNIMVV
jgi:hypothetical protein